MKSSPVLEADGSATIVNPAIVGRTKNASKQKGTLGLKARPLERNVALVAVLLASVGVLFGLLRELSVGSGQTHFVMMLAVPSLVVALATGIALPGQDEKFRPWWFAATYLTLIGLVAFVPSVAAWSADMGFGARPAIVPALACLICVMAPFAIPNQAALALGSAIPKVLVLLWAMHFTDGSSLGVSGSSFITSPQTALVAMAVLAAAVSLFMAFFRYRMPAWMMFLIGLLVTVPCISKIDFYLVRLGLM